MNQAGDEQTSHETEETVLGHGRHDPAHPFSGNFLDAFAHYAHPEQKDSQPAQYIEQSDDEVPSSYVSHDKFPFLVFRRIGLRKVCITS